MRPLHLPAIDDRPGDCGRGGSRAGPVLGLSWDTVNTIEVDATRTIVATDTSRLHGVRVIGVDEHRWSHTRRRGEDGYVTVIIDLTPVLDGTGRARLLDLVPGRSAAALTTWLSDQSSTFRGRVEVVAMDGFSGYKNAVIIDLTPVLDGTGRARLLDLVPGRSAAALTTWLSDQSSTFRGQVEVVAMDGFSGHKNAATDQLPDATPIMDPFHVVALAGAKLDLCRQRIQQLTCGHRGRTGDPLYGVRRILRTRVTLLSTRRKAKLEAVFAGENHLAVEICGSFYQRMIAAYADPDRRRGKAMMTTIIATLRSGVPEILEELAQLGRTLWRRRADVLAYFDHHVSNGPTEAINGRLEALRRNALGFRNLAHYRWRSLLHCGNLAQRIDAL